MEMLTAYEYSCMWKKNMKKMLMGLDLIMALVAQTGCRLSNCNMWMKHD